MLFTSTGYPGDYGFVPDTLAEDGDPIDVVVLLDEPTFPGCLIHARVIAVFWMRDEEGPDAKLLCVPADDPRKAHLQELGGRADAPDRRDLALLRDLRGPRARQVVAGTRSWERRKEAIQALEDARRRFAEKRTAEAASPG